MAPPAASPAIETTGLTKRYGATLALDDLDLTVEPGEVYGYLGPNGAGKTTTIRLLLGLHRPTAGGSELFGIDAWCDPVRAHRRVAYVAGEPFLWPSLTGAETLEAGVNCLPAALLFLGIGALAYALVPRASAGLAYGLVTVAFLWQLFGALFGAPKWLVEITPFAHIGAVPAQSLRVGAAAIMLGIGGLAAAAALIAFERRDLTGP